MYILDWHAIPVMHKLLHVHDIVQDFIHHFRPETQGKPLFIKSLGSKKCSW